MNHPEEPLSNGVQGAYKWVNTSLCLGEVMDAGDYTGTEDPLGLHPMNLCIWLFTYILRNKLQ